MSEWARGLAVITDEIRDWLEAIRVALGAETACLWGVEAERLVLYLSCPEGAEESVPADVAMKGHALSWVVTEGVTLRASRADVFRGGDDGWILAAPVGAPGGERVACAMLDFAHAPGAHAHRALELAANLAGRLIGDSKAALEARRDLEKNEALYGAVHDLDRKLDLDSLTRGICSRARQVAGARGAAVALWDATVGAGRIVAIDGSMDERLIQARVEGDASFLGLALANSTPLPRDRLTARERLPLYAEGLKSSAGSAIITPMLLDLEPEPIGALAVEFELPRQFNDADVKRLTALARFVAPAVRNAAQFGEVQALSLTDALTGLSNRRATERAMTSTIAVAERSDSPFAVGVLDVDHFKQFNDSYGHDAGDRVLQAVARVIRDSLRPGDVAGRWGGEEFLVVLPSTGLEDAAHVVERIRKSVEATDVLWDGRSLSVTMSAGVSAYPEVVSNAAGVVTSADAALYRAKRGGRNLVALAAWPQHT